MNVSQIATCLKIKSKLSSAWFGYDIPRRVGFVLERRTSCQRYSEHSPASLTFPNLSIHDQSPSSSWLQIVQEDSRGRLSAPSGRGTE